MRGSSQRGELEDRGQQNQSREQCECFASTARRLCIRHRRRGPGIQGGLMTANLVSRHCHGILPPSAPLTRPRLGRLAEIA